MTEEDAIKVVAAIVEGLEFSGDEFRVEIVSYLEEAFPDTNWAAIMANEIPTWRKRWEAQFKSHD